MRLIFLIEGSADVRSINRLRLKLLQRGHAAHLRKLENFRDPSYDLAIYCMCPHLKENPIDKDFANWVISINANYAFLQSGDVGKLRFERISPEIGRSASLFLSNHWRSNIQAIPDKYQNRIGFIQPHVRGYWSISGQDLKDRPIDASSHGTNNIKAQGAAKSHTPFRYREKLVREMRELQIEFSGGLFANSHTPKDLETKRVKRQEYFHTLSQSKICLAPWGSHPVSYRIFEGLSQRCLVIAQTLKNTRFLDGGLKAGVHYIEVNKELTNLKETVTHYLDNPDEAQTIADKGFSKYQEYFESGNELVSDSLFSDIVQSWGKHYVDNGKTNSTHKTLGHFFVRYMRLTKRI